MGYGSSIVAVPDPLYRVQFGGTEEDLETVAGYQEALKKLKTPTWTPPGDKDKTGAQIEADKNKKGGGRGKDKD